jgi:hypothetical protein
MDADKARIALSAGRWQENIDPGRERCGKVEPAQGRVAGEDSLGASVQQGRHLPLFRRRLAGVSEIDAAK